VVLANDRADLLNVRPASEDEQAFRFCWTAAGDDRSVLSEALNYKRAKFTPEKLGVP
jgi:hypothetical protein